MDRLFQITHPSVNTVIRMRLREARPSRSKRSRYGTRRVLVEILEPRHLLATLPFGAVSQDTAEYMLGNVVANIVFFESDGSIDPSTQNWNQLVRDQNGQVVLDANGKTISAGGDNIIERTKDRIIEGLQWWEDTLVNYYATNYVGMEPVHSLNFILNFEYAHNPIKTGYEPIDRISDDYRLWVGDFLSNVGYSTTGSIDKDIREFNNAQRLKYGADWSFTIFVANDYNDVDGRFKSGGSFTQAFAFSGGRFLVAPSRRPASTFSHETGHIFYAMDEYAYVGDYTAQRGYYDAQNLNSWDNPDPLYVHQTSLMGAGTEVEAAFQAHTSSDSSLAMIGWQDSDLDGVFDVLDVPLSLTGSGYYDAAAGLYRFSGYSTVNTLPNMNSSGRRNDITINEVSQAVYSLDGGLTWQVAKSLGQYQTDVVLAIPLTAGHEILIRTQAVDPLTGKIVATSDAEFWGTTAYPTSVANAGIQGQVWWDMDGDAAWDSGERAIPGWTVQLVNGIGEPLALQRVVEPDNYAANALLGNAVQGVTLTALGYDVRDGRVGAIPRSPASTGTKVFGAVRYGVTDQWVTEWTNEGRYLRIDLANPTTVLSIDAIASTSGGYGRLEVYDASGNLLGRTTTKYLQGTAVETMTLSVSTPRIAYAIVRATMDSAICLDNLRVGPQVTATTNSRGAFSFAALPAGTYQVQAVPTSSWVVTAPASSERTVVVGADGKMVWDTVTPSPADFGGQVNPAAPPWQNPLNVLDSNDDGFLTPIDALLIINELNRNGSRHLQPPAGNVMPPPYYDVTGDTNISPLDALRIINALNSRGTSGSGGTFNAGGSGGDGEAEGEAGSADTVASNDVSEAAGSQGILKSPTVPWELTPITGQSSAARRSTRWAWRMEETLDLLALDMVEHAARCRATEPAEVIA